MKRSASAGAVLGIVVSLLFAPGPGLRAQTGQGLAALLQALDNYPHASRLETSVTSVIDHEVGLGALQKISGAWRFKDSERLSGELTRYTWQIIDGFTSIEVMEELLARVEDAGAEQVFSCDGRACGHGSQWANRVFRQRVLYGRDGLQRYRVYGLGENTRLLIYASARTSDRQYLHAELLTGAQE